MKKLVILIMAATLMGCYATNNLHGDPTECEINCDDGDPCTMDVCDVEENCFHVPLSGCGEGCESHLDCDDADECTMDVCAFDGECVHDSICIEGLDIDGDGYDYPADCDDRRVDVHPGAEVNRDFERKQVKYVGSLGGDRQLVEDVLWNIPARAEHASNLEGHEPMVVQMDSPLQGSCPPELETRGVGVLTREGLVEEGDERW